MPKANHSAAIFFSLLLILFGSYRPVQAQVPATLSYQGVLQDESGQIVSDGEHELIFRFYDAANGGTTFWEETQTLQVRQGVFQAVLGRFSPLDDIAFDRPYFLGIQVNGGPELRPRTPLTASPYSLNSRPSAVEEALSVNAEGNVGVGTTEPGEKLTVDGVIESTSGGVRFPDGTLQTTAGGEIEGSIGESLSIGVDDPGVFGEIAQSPVLTLAGNAGREDLLHRLAAVGTTYPAYLFLKSRGTLDMPEPVQDRDFLGGVRGLGYNGTDFVSSSVIDFFVDGAPSGDIVPGGLLFRTRDETNRIATRMILRANGDLSTGHNVAISRSNTVPTERLQIGDFNQPDQYLVIKSSGGNQFRNGIKLRNFSENFGWTIENDERMVNDGLNFLSHFDNPNGESRLFLSKFGNVGIGTTQPAAELDVEGTTVTGNLSLQQKQRGGLFFAGTGDFNHALYNNFDNIDGEGGVDGIKWNVGVGLNLRVGFDDAKQPALFIDGDGDVGLGVTAVNFPLEMASGAHVTTGGVWTDASSRTFKENIADLSFEAALDALQELNPVTFNYKVEQDEDYVGFIAEEVPELVAHKDRKSLSPMDIVGVLTKVVQQQQQAIEDLKREIELLKQNQ